MKQELYLDRINEFGKHDPKSYYYLWDTVSVEFDNRANDSEESQEPEETDQGSQPQDSQESPDGQQGQDEDQASGSEGSESTDGQDGGQPEGQTSGASGKPGGTESGIGDMPSAQELQEFLQQMQDMLNQEKVLAGQEAVDRLLQQISQMRQSLEAGADPQNIAERMESAVQQLSESMRETQEQKSEPQGNESGESGPGNEQGEGTSGVGNTPGETGQAGSEQSGSEAGSSGQNQSGQPGEQNGESSAQEPQELGEQSHDQFQQGGQTHNKAEESLFSRPNEELLSQLRQAEAMVGSKFSTQDESGNITAREVNEVAKGMVDSEQTYQDQSNSRQLETLDELKRQQQLKMEAVYREMSGLDGEALRVYVEYMESTKNVTQDLTEFFVDRFKLDRDYLYERNQRRGARLQRGFTQNIIGQKAGTLVIDPRSFERKRPPESPQFAWSLIIDNSGSCSGEIIEQEKKLAVALVEVAKALNIPLEIVTFGGDNQFTFLKTFEEDISGNDLQKMVLLNADQGTPDVVTLDAACTSMEKFTDKFRRSYNFVYFMTDGQSGEGSIQEVIGKHKKNMVITGIGLAGASNTIAQTWGKNAVAVPDVKNLSDAFIRKVEEQIDQTFD